MNGSRRLKALFITHDAGIYGSGRSLQTLVKNYHDVDIDLIIPYRLIGGFKIADVMKRFGTDVKSIRKHHLPMDYCYKGKPEQSLLLYIYTMMLKVLWFFGKRWFYRQIRNGSYDFIHVNSLTLHEIMTEEYPFIMHVREIFDWSSQRAITSLRKAEGIIFIDEATKKPFEDIPLPPHIVLNNPFDMTSVDDVQIEKEDTRGIDPSQHVVFSMIGKFNENKGVGFIVDVFKHLKNDKARLLVVGSAWGAASSFDEFKKSAGDDARILCWGEEPYVIKIYALSDYIIRGEAYQCIGRTVYEGLYAGCGVIVPAEKDNIKLMFEYETFKDSIYSYTPRNAEELLELLSRLSMRKVERKQPLSNVPEYIVAFHSFILSVVRSKDICRSYASSSDAEGCG